MIRCNKVIKHLKCFFKIQLLQRSAQTTKNQYNHWEIFYFNRVKLIAIITLNGQHPTLTVCVSAHSSNRTETSCRRSSISWTLWRKHHLTHDRSHLSFYNVYFHQIKQISVILMVWCLSPTLTATAGAFLQRLGGKSPVNYTSKTNFFIQKKTCILSLRLP